MASPDPHPPPKSRVSRSAAARAVDALLKWMRYHAGAASPLLPGHGDDLINLVLALKKIPQQSRTNAFRIPLPHPLPTSVCLLVDDRPKSPLSAAAVARDLIRSLSLPVSEVITLSELRSDYLPFEARRVLSNSHDLFLADRRIIPLLPGLLGKQFFKKKKIPVPVDLARQSWPDQVRQCCGSTLMYLRTGTCSVIKVGRATQSPDEIVDNVLAAVEGAVGNVPRKWANVRSFHIKAAESLALPIYQALPEQGLKIEWVQKKEETGDRSKKRKSKAEKSEDMGAKETKRSKLVQEME